MKEGVLYYNRGVKCLPRLLVSLHTLRRVWNGPVCILNEGTPPEWFAAAVSALGGTIKSIPEAAGAVLAGKSSSWRHTPFDATMYLDSDTIVRRPVEPFFAMIREHGSVVTDFCKWITTGRTMGRRIQQWSKITDVGPALKYGHAVNTGIFGFSKRSTPLMEEYEALTRKGSETGGVHRKVLDEIAMQIAITRHNHHLAPETWNTSCIHSGESDPAIVHYHGNKHCRRGSKWADEWKKAYKAMLPAIPARAREALTASDDPSLALWLSRGDDFRDDITVVSAVNPAYADRMAVNIKKWMDTKGLCNQQFLVFVNGFNGPRDRKFLNHRNVKVVKWTYPEATPRETMLASFIFGVAEHVQTPYWMKLDADTKPIRDWQWPDYRAHTITSHKWGYTKIKGDATKEHWFTRMDRLFAGNRPIFKRALDPVKDLRIGHRRGNVDGIPMRFGSFAHIERTNFTKKVAETITGQCGRKLPIPSQDTIAWYFATLWKEPVRLMNMKEYFIP